MLPSNSPFGHSVLPSVSGTGVSYVRVAVSKDTLDGAVLLTIPDGHRFHLKRAFYEVTTAFTGGTSSAIGVSSSNTTYNTAGDLLGGASGDVAAGLTAGFKGTQGAKMAASAAPVILVGGDTIKFNRIASAFALGAGFVMLELAEIGN